MSFVQFVRLFERAEWFEHAERGVAEARILTRDEPDLLPEQRQIQDPVANSSNPPVSPDR